MRQTIAGIFLVCIFLATSAWALGSVTTGEKIPSDLSATNQYGKAVSFDTLKGEKGLTLAFVRSADWCPFCQKQLKDFNEHAAAFEKAGYPLVTVSYDSVEILKNFIDKNNISYTMLSDPRSEIINAFGLLNEEYAMGTFAYGVPHPAIYVIDDNGVVENIFYEEDYRKRPLTEDVLNAIATSETPEPAVIPEAVEPAPTLEKPAPETGTVTAPDAAAAPETMPEPAEGQEPEQAPVSSGTSVPE